MHLALLACNSAVESIDMQLAVIVADYSLVVLVRVNIQRIQRVHLNIPQQSISYRISTINILFI